MLRFNDIDTTAAPSSTETVDSAREALSTSASAKGARLHAVVGALWLILWIWSAVIDGRGVAELWMGVIGLLFMLSALWRKEHRRLEFWRLSAKHSLSTLVEYVEDVQVTRAPKKAA